MAPAATSQTVTDDTKALLERCHAESFGWARLCCRQDVGEAENVLQAVYLKILERKAVFDGRSEFRTWLFAVIRITASEMRRRRVLELLRLSRYRTPPDARPRGADEELARSELHRSLRSALRTLPRRQAEALQLVFYHEISIAQAARVMGVSLGSARTHYERGKTRLRSLMEEAGQ